MFRQKSIHQLRAIAQGYGIKDIFSKDHNALVQAIELAQGALSPKEEIIIPKPQYDARLMNKPPARLSNEGLIREALEQHTARGLHLSFDDERWYIKHGLKTDEGTLRMPLRSIVTCADKVLK